MTDPVPIDDARGRKHQRPGRVPPHNLAAEESLLGAMLMSRDAIGNASLGCTAEDFYKPAHGHIFDAILALNGRGEPADPVTVAEELRQRDLLDTIGGGPALVTLQVTTPATSNAGSYTRIVADYATRRRLIGVAAEIAELGYDDTCPLSIEQAEQLLWALADRGHTAGDAVTLHALLNDHLPILEQRALGQAAPTLTAGLSDLDTITGGFEPGAVVTIAGRPGTGKSHTGIAFALHMARTRPVLFWSLEMSRTQMADRIIANASGVATDTLRSGGGTHGLTDQQWQDIHGGVHQLGQLPIWMFTDPRAAISGLRTRARRMAARQPSPPVIVLDYLQLLEGDGRSESRQLEVSSLMRSLKRLALELDTVIIILAQVNRNLEQRTDKRPQLADLRESGSVEQDSSVVILAYRGDLYDDTNWPPLTLELHVAKNRDGNRGRCYVGYNPATGRYWNKEHHHPDRHHTEPTPAPPSDQETF